MTGDDVNEELKLKKTNNNEFQFEYYSPSDKKFLIEVQLTEDANLLFYPQKKEVTIDAECVSNIVFEAKTGLFIAGQIDPPTEGVSIKITNSKIQ